MTLIFLGLEHSLSIKPILSSLSLVLLPRAHAKRGKVVGSVVVVVVVVVSTKIARSRILGEFASVNCSYGVRNHKKKMWLRSSKPSKRDYKSYRSCFSQDAPISHTHTPYNYA